MPGGSEAVARARSRRWHRPLVPTRDVIGPIAKSVTDVALAMDVLAPKDPNDLYAPEYLWDPTPAQPERRRPTYTAFLDPHALARKRLGVLVPYIGKGTPELGVSNPIDPEVAALFAQAEADLEAEGATLVEVTPLAHTIWFVDQPNNTARWTSLGSNGAPGTLQFGGDFYGEAEIIGYAYDYEQATMHRMSPRLRAARRLRECSDLPGGRCAKRAAPPSAGLRAVRCAPPRGPAARPRAVACRRRPPVRRR
jgi:Asp-tRNA(Asn)/Glu-tRNA(Gln) amidotransferase A subunit family amidase